MIWTKFKSILEAGFILLAVYVAFMPFLILGFLAWYIPEGLGKIKKGIVRERVNQYNM